MEVNGNDIVTAKSVVNSIVYTYDSEETLTRKKIMPAGEEPFTYWYEKPENEDQVSKFKVSTGTVTSHSHTDAFGRKEFDELQLGTCFLSRRFSYLTMPGAESAEVVATHVQNQKVKSTPTTNLVSRIEFSDGRTLAYEYDAEERITKVTDSVDGVTEYTYDAMGQLLTEKVNGEVKNTMTYDGPNALNGQGGYGNIRSKNGVSYTYGDGIWKDLLTMVGNQTITYDAQGNPTSYLGHALTWEKGRQLKSFDSNTYTYNANGIRTSKTVNGVKHTYTLDGTKILRETWGNNTLIPLYDNEDSVCGILYNDTPYYFLKNLQGDIIEIKNAYGVCVARYSYDAWGAVTSAVTYTELTEDVDIASINPFRYRGYYYDEEIELYYLQSRYYDSKTGKFISSDDAVFGLMATIESARNIFCYCHNNAVNMIDKDGHAAANIVGGIIGGVIGALLGYIVAEALGLKGWKKLALIGAVTIAGAVLGAILGPYIAKASKHVINIINSGIRKASNAAFKAASKVKKFTVSSKHLSNAGGRYAKFATTKQSQVQSWVSQALKSPNATFHPNGSGSYYIITDMGKAIGTKGERLIKVVFDTAGKIWTAYPMK